MSAAESEKPLLYIVDDDAELRRSLSEFLSSHGFEVIGFSTADAFLLRLRRLRPALAILDVMMPGTGGLQALRSLRKAGEDVPVIVLTARNQVEDRVTGLSLGADDFLGKPFSIHELLARIRAVLRRRPATGLSLRAPHEGSHIQFGTFVIDPRARRLYCNGAPIDILVADFALLKALATHPFKPLSRERLVELSGARITDKRARSIDVQVLRLRRIIETDPAHPTILQTVRGIGYAFVPP